MFDGCVENIVSSKLISSFLKCLLSVTSYSWFNSQSRLVPVLKTMRLGVPGCSQLAGTLI